MIKRKIKSILLVALTVAVLALVVHPTHARAIGGDFIPWPIPDQPFTLPISDLAGIEDAASAEAVIAYAVTHIGYYPCEDALALMALFIEDAIRRGAAFDVPANGVFYTDMLQVTAGVAQNINVGIPGILDDAGINLARPLRTNISFVSSEPGILNISFPDDVSGIGFDNITVETEFASVTLNREFVSGSAIRIERGVPVATGGYAYYTYTAYGNGGGFIISHILDFWSVGVLVVVIVIWGVLASRGKKLRVWVVPVVFVIAIAANVWTLGLNQEGPDSAISAPAPVYFYSVAVAMPPGMSAVLSVPIGGQDPEMLVLVNEQSEPQLSRYNPFTDAIEAHVHTGGIYFLKEMDIRG